MSYKRVPRIFQIYRSKFCKICRSQICIMLWWTSPKEILCITTLLSLFIQSMTLLAKIHQPDSTKSRLSSNRWILEILLLSTNMKLLFLHIKEIFSLTSSKSDSGILLFCTNADTNTFHTPCDVHFTAAFLLFSIRFSIVSALLSVFYSRSFTSTWRTAES